MEYHLITITLLYYVSIIFFQDFVEVSKADRWIGQAIKRGLTDGVFEERNERLKLVAKRSDVAKAVPTSQPSSLPFAIGLQSLPSEILEGALMRLPIDSSLREVGLASKQLFAPYIFHSSSFPRRHFQHLYTESRCSTVWDFLEMAGIKYRQWQSLPFSYQIAIYREIMAEEDWDGVADIGDDWPNNLMWSLRWDLSRSKAVKLMQALLDTGFDPSSNETRSLRWACRNGHLEVVELLLRHEAVDPGAESNMSLQFAADNGHADIVRKLLMDPGVDPTADDNFSICKASENGHVEVVRALLEDGRADPSANENHSIRLACEDGYYEIVDLLMNDPRVDPSVKDNVALGVAAEFGRTRIIQRLLQDSRVKPSDFDNYALRFAVGNGHLEVAKCLWKDPRTVVSAIERQEMIKVAQDNQRDDIVEFLMNNE
ncbi:hypothetical protein HDU79_006455 [Rhizoclosmatium sp. JEL0117]|nr:hypothetical protein HDU79_006455 [Rhizoclosmatium sp. JEL0117]